MIKFGTGGWRAIIGDEYTKENLCILCTAIAHMMVDEGKTSKPFIIGYDRRFLSKESAMWAAEIFVAHGIHCEITDRDAPTPLVMYAVMKHNLDYGIEITASHNPYSYNGVKLFIEGGRDADEETTKKLESYIEKVTEVIRVPYETALAEGKVTIVNYEKEYVDSILNWIRVEEMKGKPLKIALDPMYGMSHYSLEEIFEKTGSQMTVFNQEHNPLFGGQLPAPSDDTLDELKDMVVKGGYDLGIATDGDADRIGIIDECGAYVDSNKLLVILYYYLLKYRGMKGPVVRNISTTHMLDAMATAYGEVCYEVPVGFKHISHAMDTHGAIIGGESSGGLTVQGHILGKDGIFAGALLAEVIAVSGMKLSELYDEILKEFDHTYNIALEVHLANNQEKSDLYNLIYTQKVLPEYTYEVEKVSYEDGCKIYFKNGGWVMARFSGTEPLLRIAAEMVSSEEALSCAELFKQTLGL